jgi:hypothetical protein
MRQRVISVLFGTCSVLALDLAVLAIARAQTPLPMTKQSPVETSGSNSPLQSRMFQNGMGLLARGDVVAAREFFEIGAGDGHAGSAYALALTYDADALRRRGLASTFADEGNKALWAARATALGYAPSTSNDAGLNAATVPATTVPPSTSSLAPATATQELRTTATVPTRSPPTIVDGTYSTHVMAGCGEAFQSVLVKIERGAISFEHLVKGVPYGWRGMIDASGAITATVEGTTGYRAVGSFEDKSIDLTYPQCGATPMTMRVRWLVR